ncbi:unnamed protein product [Cunninghamella echinulata]
MQSMPYYQQGYQASAPYASAPAPAGLVMTNAPPPMITHPNGLPPLQHHDANGQPAKRKQVKNACTNCQKACKKCDDARPCPRCIKYGIADTCVNSVRKERKKGIKRGPYKRRQKTDGEKPAQRKTTTSLPEDQAGQYANAMRAPPIPPYGFPGNLTQYGHYDAYNHYYKDQMMPQYNVMNPVYQPMAYPVLVQQQQQQQQGDNNNNGTNNNNNNNQQQQPQQQAPPQHASYQHLPQHYGNMVQHPSHPSTPQQQNNHSSPQPARNDQPNQPLYYQPQHQQQTNSNVNTPQRSPEPKSQAMTPVPSASTSTGTSSSPSESTDGGLNQLSAAAAALHKEEPTQ